MNEAQLPPGQKWHNPDKLPSAGEPPWRFLVEGEEKQDDDEFWYPYGPKPEWVKVNPRRHMPEIGNTTTYRTRRKLPAIPESSVPAQGEEKRDESKCPTCGERMDLVCDPTGEKEFYKCWPCDASANVPTVALGGTPSLVAPSGGEEEDREETIERNPKSWIAWKRKAQIAGELLQRAWKWLDWIESRHSSDLRPDETPSPLRKEIEGFIASTHPAPSPAEAPTPEHEQWHALPVTMASRSLSYQGKVLGTFGNETAMRLAATHNDEVTALQRELSAMRQERESLIGQLAQCFKHAGADCDGNEDWRIATRAVEEVAKLRADYHEACAEVTKTSAQLATVTAERDVERERVRQMIAGKTHDDGIHAKTLATIAEERVQERKELRASAESARKDGERLDLLQNHWLGISPNPVCWEFRQGRDNGKSIRDAIDEHAARLTSEGGR